MVPPQAPGSVGAGRGVIRPRPIDVNKQLAIVRETGLLDTGDLLPSREVFGGNEVLDKAQEEARLLVNRMSQRGKEIPVPFVRVVPSYTLDYLPIHKEPRVYIRGKAGVGYQEDDWVDYDLDREDEAWLTAFNRDQERMTRRRFEQLLWKLDSRNLECTNATLQGAGATMAERTGTAARAATEHMGRDEAYAAIAQVAPVRPRVRDLVYKYWQKKRRRLARPLLRRLQAPTSANDTNPHHVFRPRDKANRPQTRRRRDNTADNLEKLREIRANLQDALPVAQLVLKREKKKQALVYVEIDQQQFRMRSRHEPPEAQARCEADYAALVASNKRGRPLGFDARTEKLQREQEAADPANANVRRVRKRRRESSKPQPLAALPTPPLPAQPQLLFKIPPRLPGWQTKESVMEVPLEPRASDQHQCMTRVGRNGRLWFDRCDPFSYAPFSGELASPAAAPALEPPQYRPLWEQPNPFLSPAQRQAQQQVQGQDGKASRSGSVAPSQAPAAPAASQQASEAAPAASAQQPGQPQGQAAVKQEPPGSPGPRASPAPSGAPSMAGATDPGGPAQSEPSSAAPSSAARAAASMQGDAEASEGSGLSAAAHAPSKASKRGSSTAPRSGKRKAPAQNGRAADGLAPGTGSRRAGRPKAARVRACLL